MDATSRPTVASSQTPWQEIFPGDLYNPPGLTNFLGCVQAARDVLAIEHLTFAPFSMGPARLFALSINDVASAASGTPIAYQWRLDRIARKSVLDGFHVETEVVMGVASQSVALSLQITNTGDVERRAKIEVVLGDGVMQQTTGWRTPYSPREAPAISTTPWEGEPPAHTRIRNHVQPHADGHGLIFSSQTSQAVCVQAMDVRPDALDDQRLTLSRSLTPGATLSIQLWVGIDEERVAVEEAYAQWRRAPGRLFEAATAAWEAELDSAFGPPDDRYSGQGLPYPSFENRDLQRLYDAAIFSVLMQKRDHPRSSLGRVYTTLMPRYWVTTSFINDWSLSAWLLNLLDPMCARKMIETWLARDIYAHFGIEYVSGENAGNWYACNDYAMTRLISVHIHATGDRAWLDKVVGAHSIRDHLRKIARHYTTLDRSGRGLADYGDRNSLLECVGTYEHAVASLNAANVWILRTVAALIEGAESEEGDGYDTQEEVRTLRAEARALAKRVLSLYVSGKGYWRALHPDGKQVPVRHIWDFIHTINLMHEDLEDDQIAEMVAFFERELRTDHWASALSASDTDASFSLRPDHQWNGSYPAWVALAMGALLHADRPDLLRAWLPGLARATQEGPFSQAHFVETYAPLLNGGARKAPTDWPYINDWTILVGGAFFDVILTDILGIQYHWGERIDPSNPPFRT